MPDSVNINLAGSCRGRSGPGAFGLSISTPLGDVLLEKGEYLPETSLSAAVYTGLLAGLEEAARLGARRVIVNADCDVVVNQMRGRLAVREDPLKVLHQKAWMLAARLHFQIIHVPPERNRPAISLAQATLAAANPENPPPPPPPPPRPQPPPVDPAARKVGIQVSAGGVVYKREGKGVHVCLIAKGKAWALPKGRINEGETSEETASREIQEETGHLASVEEKLHDIDYWFYWKENNTLYHKTVSFFLMPLIEENKSVPDGEADLVQWFLLGDAWQRLTYPNEKDVLRKAMLRLKREADAAPPPPPS